MVNHSSTEQWWDSLLRFIDDGKVVPIVGRDLLWVDVDGPSVHLPRLLAEQFAEKLHVELPEDLGGDPVDAVVRRYFLLLNHYHEWPYSERPLSCAAAHQDSLVAVAWSPDGTRVVTGSMQRIARISCDLSVLCVKASHFPFVPSCLRGQSWLCERGGCAMFHPGGL